MMKNRYYSKLFISFLFLLLTPIIIVSAQPKHLQFKHLTLDDGLSSSSTMCILQDYKGFMWVGTINGLNRYDGLGFVVYKNNPSDSSSLTDNNVRVIFEDHQKNLFIGTQNGLCLYDREKDRFLNYMLDISSPLKGTTCVVLKIAEDSLGNLWLATDIGLIYFDRNSQKIIQYTHDPGNPASLSSNEVEYVYIDKCGRLWVATRKGLNLFQSERGTFKHIARSEIKADDLSNTFFIGIAEDREGSLWFGSTEGLFCLEKNKKNIITPLKHYQNNLGNKNSLSNNRAKSLFVDDVGNLWIGTENGGLNLFDKKNKCFWRYRMDEYNPKSLNNESIWAIYQDKSGNLWVCTFTGGLNIAMTHGDAIIHYRTLPGAPLSLSHNAITCFLEDHLRQKWVGTDGGLNLFNDQTNRFLRFNIENSNLSSNAVLCILEDSNHQIWLGTWAGGLVHFDSRTRSFTSFTTKNSNIQDNNIFAIAEGDNNDLWLGSFENGLIHYQIKEKKFTNYLPSNSGLANKMIVKLEKDSKGRLFIGSTNCFQIFSPNNKRFTTYSNDPNNAGSLSHSTINDILVENDSCVWIGTQDGLNRFNPNTGSFIRYYEKDGLPNNVIKGLVLDKSGVLWVTTNNGVSRFDYRKGNYKNFTKTDGLQSNEFNFRSTLRTRSGALLLGGTSGFNMIFPEKIAENMNIPQVLITDFHIFNEPVKIGAEDSPLNKNISETEQITLSYKQAVLTFYFAVMDFAAPEKNRYAYMMENFDQKWIYAGNKKEATYTNLDPGEYVFRVKGSNNDGLWNEAGVAIRITITPPFWRTLWFRFILLAVFLGIFYWIYKWRVQTKYLAAQRSLDAALAKERNLLRTLIDNLPDLIYVKDAACRKTLSNLADIRFIGKESEAEVLGKTDFDFYPKEMAELFYNDDRQVIQTGQPVIDREEYSFDENGQKRWLLTSKFPLRDEKGRVVSLIGISHDITNRKMIEEELRKSEAKMRLIFDNAFDGISVYEESLADGTRRLVECNQRYAEMAGRSKEELFKIGNTLKVQKAVIREIPEVNWLETTGDSKIEKIHEGENFKGLFSWNRPDGKENTIEYNAVTINIDGKYFTIGSDHDLTDRLKLQQELVQSQKMQSIGTLAGGIAHDFNNILGIILGYVSLLEKYKLNEQKYSESIAIVKQTVQRGAALVRQILTFARKTDIVFEPMDVVELIHEIVSMLEQTFPRVITFNEILSTDTSSIIADRTQIHQAILNLCVNARDAMPDGGQITIEVGRRTKEQIGKQFATIKQEAYLCISVKDTGEGMDEATRLRVFDPFFTTKEKGKGTGMGLSVVYGVVQTHQGFIDLESEVGKGTTFRLFFPLVAQNRKSTGMETPAESFTAGGSETILLVEDEEFLLDLVCLMLESKGYKVYSAKDGIEAIEVYKQHKQDIALVCTDLGLPGVTGIAEFKQLKEINPDIKIVFASGYFEPDVKSELFKAGAKGFISKPYMTEEVLRLFRKVLDE